MQREEDERTGVYYNYIIICIYVLYIVGTSLLNKNKICFLVFFFLIICFWEFFFSLKTKKKNGCVLAL